MLPNDGEPPNTVDPPNAGAPPNDGVPPKAVVPAKVGLLNADEPGEPNPLCATLPVVGVLNAPPLGLGDPKLLLPNPDVLLAAPPKMDCPDCGEVGCPNVVVPNPPAVGAPAAVPPKIFPELVFAVPILLPNGALPPKIDPPVAEVVTDPKRPPPLEAPVFPKILEAVVAGVVAAPNGLDGCCEPAVAPPNIEPELGVDEVVATDPNKLEKPPVELPNVEVVELAVPKIDPPEAALLVATDPKRPVPEGLLALVTAAAVDPKIDAGFDVSVAVVPKVDVEPPPKMDVVSAFGVEKEVLPKMFPEEGFSAAGVAGEHMLNELKRFDVLSVVEVGVGVEGVVVVVVARLIALKETLEEVVGAMVVVATFAGAGAVMSAGVEETVAVVRGAEVAVVGLTMGFASLEEGSDLIDRSVGLSEAAAKEKPLPAVPPKENPVPADVVTTGFTDPNKEVDVEVTVDVVSVIVVVAVLVVDGVVVVVAASVIASSPDLKLGKDPLLEVAVVVVVAGLILPKSPVPGAIVAVEEPKILEDVVFEVVPKMVCDLVSTVVESPF